MIRLHKSIAEAFTFRVCEAVVMKAHILRHAAGWIRLLPRFADIDNLSHCHDRHQKIRR